MSDTIPPSSAEVDLDSLAVPPDLAGQHELAWLIEVADWRSPVDRSLGRVARAWNAVRGLGTHLGAVLSDSFIQDPTDRVDNELRVLNLVSDHSGVLALPWELAAIGEGLTVGDVFAVNRVPRSIVAKSADDLPHALSVLTIAPRPLGEGDVPRADTQRPLLDIAARHPERVAVVGIRPPTFQRLAETVQRRRPFDVFHFDGHGTTRADGLVDLLFESESSRPAPVAARALVALLADAPPRLVLLNACRSGWSAGLPSLSFALATALPGVQVIAMSHAVTLRTAGVLLEQFFPALATGSRPIRALALAQRTLRNLSANIEAGPPDHVVPVLYGPPLDATLQVEAALDEQPGHEQIVLVYDWERELHEVDDLLNSSGDEPVTVRGPLLSGKSCLIGMVENYRRLVGHDSDDTLRTRLHEQRDCWSPPPPRTVTIGQAPVAIGARWWTALSTASGLQPDERAIQPGRLGFEAVYLAGSHVGTMGFLSDLAAAMPLHAAIEELKWGAAAATYSTALEVVYDALESVDEDRRRLARRVGCFGGLVSPRLLASMDDPISGPASSELVDAALVTLKNLATVGLVQPFSFRGGLMVAVSPLVDFALRRELAAVEGSAALAAVERRVIDFAVGLAFGRAETKQIATRVEMFALHHRQEEELTLLEQLFDRCLGVAIRLGHDQLAATLVTGVTHDLHPSTSVYRRALQLLMHRVSFDRPMVSTLPIVRGAQALAQARADEVDELWENVLTGTAEVRASSAQSGTQLLAEPLLLVMEARATWRTGRASEAARLLARADQVAAGNASLEAAVGSAYDDFDIFTKGRRTRRGSDVMTWLNLLRTAEEAGDLRGAAAIAERASGDAAAAGNQVDEAEALTEQGRLLYLTEDPRAVAVLESALRLQAEVGRPTYRLLYLLAGAFELAGKFDDASDALDAAWAASEGPGRAANRADIVFERGNVALRAAVAPGGEIPSSDPQLTLAVSNFALAQEMYEELELPALAAGAAEMLAQTLDLMEQQDGAKRAADEAERLALRSGRDEVINRVRKLRARLGRAAAEPSGDEP